MAPVGEVYRQSPPSLVGEIVEKTHDETFDLSRDGLVDANDLDLWLAFAAHENGLAAPYLTGDANLDGKVNASDLDALGQNWLGHPNVWQGGDFNADGTVDSLDLNGIGKNWLREIPSTAVRFEGVSEPAAATLLMLGVAALSLLRKSVYRYLKSPANPRAVPFFTSRCLGTDALRMFTGFNHTS